MKTRWMIRRDLPEAMAIEHSSQTHPWLENDFLVMLRQRRTIGMVCEHDSRVLGYIVYTCHRKQVLIDNLAVHPDHRREGVGRVMVGRLIGKLECQRRNQIMVNVRESDLATQLFLQRLGFLAFHIYYGYFVDNDEAAYEMVYVKSGQRGERWPTTCTNRIKHLLPAG